MVSSDNRLQAMLGKNTYDDEPLLQNSLLPVHLQNDSLFEMALLLDVTTLARPHQQQTYRESNDFSPCSFNAKDVITEVLCDIGQLFDDEDDFASETEGILCPSSWQSFDVPAPKQDTDYRYSLPQDVLTTSFQANGNHSELVVPHEDNDRNNTKEGIPISECFATTHSDSSLKRKVSIEEDPCILCSCDTSKDDAFTQVGNQAKKRRTSGRSVKLSDAAIADDQRFRSYQAEQWNESYADLCFFLDKHGHCQVPHTYSDNPALARWVKRQRYQYRLKQEGKPSTMSDERIAALEKIGFVWDSHGSTWDERLNELEAFKAKHGNCNVPSCFLENPRLATWVKCQRRQYKLFCQGKPSNITLERIEKLQGLGFEWALRGQGFLEPLA